MCRFPGGFRGEAQDRGGPDTIADVAALIHPFRLGIILQFAKLEQIPLHTSGGSAIRKQ